MATHNNVHLAGYLLKQPSIANLGVEGAEKVFLNLRTLRRDADDVGKDKYEDLFILYDGTEMINLFKKLQQFDILQLKGVFNIVAVNKPSKCPACGQINVKANGTYSFVYPIWAKKQDNLLNSHQYNADLPDSILRQHYAEVSNYLTIIGTLVTKPQMVGSEKEPVCRYRLGIDRKYYIKTQPDVHADYPWVYSYGQQALDDYRHLQEKSVVLVDGYIHTHEVAVTTECEACKTKYRYPDIATDLIPYAIEYLSDYKTDEDIAREEELRRRGLA